LPSPLIDLQRAMQGERLFVDNLLPDLRGSARTAPLSRPQLQAAQDRILDLLSFSEGGFSKDDWRAKLALAAFVARQYPASKQRLLTRDVKAADVAAMPLSQVVLLDTLDEYERHFDEFLKWANLPYWQAREGLQAAEANLKAERAKGADTST